jgi:hypothetical protein
VGLKVEREWWSGLVVVWRGEGNWGSVEKIENKEITKERAITISQAEQSKSCKSQFHFTSPIRSNKHVIGQETLVTSMDTKPQTKRVSLLVSLPLNWHNAQNLGVRLPKRLVFSSHPIGLLSFEHA